MQAIALLATVVTAFVACSMIDARSRHVLEPNAVIVIDGFPELSGLAFWPQRGTLIGVSDAGIVGEIALDGRVLRSRGFEGYDLEDVVLEHGGSTALLVDEAHSRLLRIGLDDFAIQSERSLPIITPAKGHNREFEGLTFDEAANVLVLVHESHPAAVVLLNPETLVVEAIQVLDAERATAGIVTDVPHERCVLSRDAGIALVDGDGVRTAGWLPIQGRDLEGIALVPGMGLVMCSDATPSRLSVFSGIGSWDALRAVMRSRSRGR